MVTKDIRFPSESTKSEGIPESEAGFFTKSGSSPTVTSVSSTPPSEPRTNTKSAHPKKVKKETAAQRKLRKAQELVKAAKQKEQAAWRATWEAQQRDPAYKAKQARLADTREERSRKMAIGKENAQLARQAELMEQGGGPEELKFTAYHEAGHAVMHEVLGNGVAQATIIPEEVKGSSDSDKGGLSLGHVNPRTSHFPIPKYQENLYEVVCTLAGGMVVHSVYDLDSEEDGTGGDEDIVSQIIKSMSLNDAEESDFLCDAWTLGENLLADPKVWEAIEEVKEALLTYKTIPGDVVRAIVKKQDHPDLFPLEISKQLSFHYRKEFATDYWGRTVAPYSLGIGDNHSGFTLSSPQYVTEFLQANKVLKEVEAEGVIDLDPREGVDFDLPEGVIDLDPEPLPMQLTLDLRPAEVQNAVKCETTSIAA